MKFNIDKTICINLEVVNDQQLLAIALTYNFNFKDLIKLKIDKISKIWFEIKSEDDFTTLAIFSNNSLTFLYENGKSYSDDDSLIYYGGLTKKEYIKFMNIIPIKTPTMPKHSMAIISYEKYLKEGKYDIDTKSMNNALENKNVDKRIKVINLDN